MSTPQSPWMSLTPPAPWRWVSAAVAGAVAVAAVVVLGTASWSSVNPFDDDELPADAVMRVHGMTVTEADLETRLESLQALYGIVAPTDAADLDKFRRDAAKSLAVSLVIEHEADERDLVVSTKQAESELAKIVDDQLGGDRSTFVQYLGQVGLTEDQVLAEIKRTLLNSRLYDEITQGVPAATEAEAKAEYESRRDAMHEADKRRLSNIVVETEEQATKVLTQLSSGTSFSKVAKAVSLDAQTRDKGGDIGELAQAELEPGYAEVAFAAEQGEPFGPVQTQYGWNVGLVRAIVPGRNLTFEEAKATLLQALTTEAALEEWRDFLRTAIADADITYSDQYRPADPDALPSDLETEPTP